MINLLKRLVNCPEFHTQVSYKLKTYKPNIKIVHEGQTYKSFYIIKSGKVRIAVKGELAEGKHPLHPAINQLKAGDLFGEFGLFTPEPACADVIAAVETQVLEVDMNSFREFLKNNPVMGYEIILEMWKLLVARLRHANTTIVKLYAWGIRTHEIDKYLS